MWRFPRGFLSKIFVHRKCHPKHPLQSRVIPTVRNERHTAASTCDTYGSRPLSPHVPSGRRICFRRDLSFIDSLIVKIFRRRHSTLPTIIIFFWTIIGRSSSLIDLSLNASSWREHRSNCCRLVDIVKWNSKTFYEYASFGPGQSVWHWRGCQSLCFWPEFGDNLIWR